MFRQVGMMCHKQVINFFEFVCQILQYCQDNKQSCQFKTCGLSCFTIKSTDYLMSSFVGIKEQLFQYLSECRSRPNIQSVVRIGEAYLEALSWKIVHKKIKINPQHSLQPCQQHNQDENQNKKAKDLISNFVGASCQLVAGYIFLDGRAEIETQILAFVLQNTNQTLNNSDYSQFDCISSKVSQSQMSQSETFPFDEKDESFHLDISVIKPAVNTKFNFQPEPRYIQNVLIYRSQINLFSQLLKLPGIVYHRQRFNSVYYIRAEFKVKCKQTKDTTIILYGQGQNPLLKMACQTAAYEILSLISTSMPNLWSSFMWIKRKKGLI